MKTKSKILSAILSVSILSASLSAFVSGSLGVQAAESSPTVSANKYKLKDNIQDGVILHCFDWTYNDIKAELPKIAKAGFTSIQTSRHSQTEQVLGIGYISQFHSVSEQMVSAQRLNFSRFVMRQKSTVLRLLSMLSLTI